MNYLRKIVSGKRRRFQDGQYDLDITYITTRVIAMSYPASGMEKAFRNPIAMVAKFLKERHGENYWIFNCSERAYDKTKFDNQVSDFLWKDHHAPTLQLLYSMVKQMYEFLQKDERNVVVIHCNSGKGRTGTAIASLLVFSGFVENIDDALKYYGWKRFSSGTGVTQPCQLRMIYYFESVYKNIVICPTIKKLKAIIIKTVPKMSNEGCRPYFEITNNIDDDIIYTNRNQTNLRFYPLSDHAMAFNFEESEEPVIFGDVHFIFKHKGSMSDSQMCRIAFNSSFIPSNNNLVFKKQTVSPDKIKKDSRFSEDLQIAFIFEDYCYRCNSPWTMELDSLCQKCKKLLNQDFLYWKSISRILQHHDFPTLEEGIKLHRVCDLDRHTILGLHLMFDSQNYIIKKPVKMEQMISPRKEGIKQIKGKAEFDEEEKDNGNVFEGFDFTAQIQRRTTLHNHDKESQEFKEENGHYQLQDQVRSLGSNFPAKMNKLNEDEWQVIKSDDTL